MYVDEQAELGGGPEGEEVVGGDDAGVVVLVGEEGVGVVEVFLEGLDSAPAEGVGLVLVYLDEHLRLLIKL